MGVDELHLSLQYYARAACAVRAKGAAKADAPAEASNSNPKKAAKGPVAASLAPAAGGGALPDCIKATFAEAPGAPQGSMASQEESDDWHSAEGVALLELPVHMMLTGERVALLNARADSTVEALATDVETSVQMSEALALSLWHDGARLPAEVTLHEAGLQDGSRIDVVFQRQARTLEFHADTVRVLRGESISSVNIGGQPRSISQGQLPPSSSPGDSWEFDFDAAPGEYEIVFRGGKNPHHGILTVRIDDEVIGTVDQFARRNEYPTEDVVRWRGSERSGRHALRGTVEASHPDTVGRRYWFCLTTIEIRPCESLVACESSDPGES